MYKSYFKLLRIKDWRAYFLIALLGFLVSKGYLSSLREIITFWTVILFFLAFGFSINDCFDTKEDALDSEKRKLVISREISFQKGLFFSIVLVILGLFLTIRFGLIPFLLALGNVLLALFYSAPPLRFKSRPFLDLFSHGLFAGALIFLFPVLIFNKNLELFHYLIAFSIFWVSVSMELRNHLEDYEFDKKAGLKTTVCFLGLEKAEKLLRSMTSFFPLIFSPIFFLFSSKYLILFLILTLIFLPVFLFSPLDNKQLMRAKEKFKKLKNYRIIDAYTIFSFGLIIIATI